VPQHHRRRVRLPQGRWLWLAAFTAIVVVLATAVVLRSTGSSPSGGCAGKPVTLTVVTSAAQFPALDRLARRWSAGKPSVDGRCVAVSAVRMADPDVAARLRTAWKGSPRPDVWVPQSTLWLGIASSRLQVRSLLPQAPTSIASSPIVMAVRRSVAESWGWPGRSLTWKDVLDSGAPMGIADPNRSTEGLSTVVALLDRNADGGVSDAELANGPGFTRAIGTVVPDTSVFLGDRGGQPAPAPVPSPGPQPPPEAPQQPTPDIFPAIERDIAVHDAADPAVPYVPVYLADGPVAADYPYAVLSASWVDGLHRRTADRFLRYLLSPEGQDVLGSEGFREPGGSPVRAPQLVPERGFAMATPQPREMSTLAVSQVASEWTALSRNGNLLVVVDTSASMNRAVPGTTVPRIDLARKIVIGGLNRVPGGTSVALWEFATGLTAEADYRELVPFGPVTEQPRIDAVVSAVGGLRPAGDTALYDTVYAAFRTVQSRWRPNANNAVVVITDGTAADEKGMDRAQLIEALKREARPDRPVMVVGVAVGSVAAAGSLRDITRVTGGATFPVSDATTAVNTLTLAFAGRLH
jgi:Ca-activated chloride channel family protein